MSAHRHTTMGTGVIILRPGDHKILIGKRGEACRRGKGLWALPGGMIDESETIVAGLIREIYEETGIFVDPLTGFGKPPFLTTAPFAVTDHVGEENHISLWYIVGVDSQTPNELLDCDFFPAKEPTKCEGWHWKTMQQIGEITGVNDKHCDRSDSQYHWLPMNVFRATLPRSLFGIF